MLNLFKGHKPNIIICSPIPFEEVDGEMVMERVTVEWMRCRMNLTPPFNMTYREICIDGLPIDEARCRAAECAVECNTQYIFFHDYDVLLPEDTLHRLVYHLGNHPECDVASGVYCCKMNPPIPLIYKGINKETYWDWTPGDILIDNVTGCPMGCALIRTSVFHKLSKDKPWFKTIPNECSEDIWFLNRMQDEIGSKILIDTSLLCPHIQNRTRVQYNLPEDSLPIRNYLAKDK